MDLTRYGAEIAAIVGLFTIAGVLWRLFVRMRDTFDVVTKLPPKLDATNEKVDVVDRKVDLMTAEHLHTKEQLHTGMARLEANQGAIDGRLRGVEEKVSVLKDRREQREP